LKGLGLWWPVARPAQPEARIIGGAIHRGFPIWRLAKAPRKRPTLSQTYEVYQHGGLSQALVLPPSESRLYKVRCRRCGSVTPKLQWNPIPEWSNYFACRCPSCTHFIKRVRRDYFWGTLAVEQGLAQEINEVVSGIFRVHCEGFSYAE